MVSAKCKGAVKSYPGGRERERETERERESLRDKSVGSSWQRSHDAGGSLSESFFFFCLSSP